MSDIGIADRVQMEPLARWIQREDPSTGDFLVVFAAMAGAGSLAAIGAAIYEASSGSLPFAAWFFCTMMVLITIGFTIPAVRSKRKSRTKGASLASLRLPAFQGKLAEALGPRAEVLGNAAADLEQMEALLTHAELESEFSTELRESANRRLRRMLDLTVAPPGQHGLSIEQAGAQIETDGQWLTEARRLVESTQGRVAPSDEDQVLGDLKALVQAREELLHLQA